jgi:hypothetical protein
MRLATDTFEPLSRLARTSPRGVTFIFSFSTSSLTLLQTLHIMTIFFSQSFLVVIAVLGTGALIARSQAVFWSQVPEPR